MIFVISSIMFELIVKKFDLFEMINYVPFD